MNVDQMFLATARFCPDAAVRRAPYRQAHLAHVRSLVDDGTAVIAGAVADLSVSVLVLRVGDERAARAVMVQDPYWRNGIWTSLDVVGLLVVAGQS